MKIENAALTDLVQPLVQNKEQDRETSKVGEQQAFFVDKADMAGGIFGEAVYQKPKADAKETLEDIANQAQQKDAVMMKNEMLFASNTTSGKDIEKMEEDGFQLMDTEVETIVTETDKIKMQLAKAGVDISIFGDGLSDEQLEELAGNEALARQLANEIAAADLPVTKENLKEAVEAAGIAQELDFPTEGAMKYMLDNQLEPTIENLYKAEFSGSSSYRAPQGNAEYEGMKEQITNVIENAGLEVTQETFADSQWLMDNEIPLTPENLLYLQDLKGIKLPAQQADTVEAIVTALKEGRRPKDGMLIEGYSLYEQAKKAAEVVEQADEESLQWLLERDMELTVENLHRANNATSGMTSETADIRENKSVIPVTAEKELALITARRQLEEARLVMTAEANYSLLKQGISIDTKPLTALVEALKAQENSYYENLLMQAGIPATGENTAIYRQTTETVEALKEVPAYTLGIPKIDEAGLEELYKEGKALEDSFKRAGESYETLMTAPRRDMGDSIQKAFANIDDILKDLGLEATEANQRAVRILAYNSLEITEESVLEMKAKDMAVQRCFANMTPSVVREMIRDGVNPLDMSIDELNQLAVEIKRELGVEEEERFSKYLWKMDRSGSMSEEERSAFLGIYRLITQVEKTDGAAIGALLEQGSPFTMRNLLTQIRSGKHSRKEYTVDDAFGGVEASGKGLSITAQIEKGYQANCVQDILQNLTPEKLGELLEDDSWLDLTPEQLAEKLKESGMKNETVVQEEALEQAYRQEKTSALEACQKAPQEVYQMLMDCDMPATVQNVLAAYEMITNRNEAFRRFFEKRPNEKNTLDEEFQAAKQKLLEDFAEAVKTPEEMAKAQKELAETAENVMKTMIDSDESVRELDIRQMKMLNTQIAIGTAQLKEETYAIPVLVGDEVTNVSLKIVRGKEKKGMVDISLSTDRLGEIVARLSAINSGISGYIASDRKTTTELFASHAAEFSQILGGENADISYVTSGNLNASGRSTNGEIGREEVSKEQGTEDYEIQTKTLYYMAESFIRLVKGLE